MYLKAVVILVWEDIGPGLRHRANGQGLGPKVGGLKRNFFLFEITISTTTTTTTTSFPSRKAILINFNRKKVELLIRLFDLR